MIATDDQFAALCGLPAGTRPLESALNGSIPDADWHSLECETGAVVWRGSLPHPFAPTEEGLQAICVDVRCESGTTYRIACLEEARYVVGVSGGAS